MTLAARARPNGSVQTGLRDGSRACGTSAVGGSPGACDTITKVRRFPGSAAHAVPAGSAGGTGSPRPPPPESSTCSTSRDRSPTASSSARTRGVPRWLPRSPPRSERRPSVASALPAPAGGPPMLDCRPALDHLVERVLLLRAGMRWAGGARRGGGRARGRQVHPRGIRRRGPARPGLARRSSCRWTASTSPTSPSRRAASRTARGRSTPSTARASPPCSAGCGPEPDTVWAPTYDRSIEESVAGAIGVPPGTDVVVTEGNYLLVDDEPWSAGGSAARRGVGGAHVTRRCAPSDCWPGTCSSASPPRGPCLGGSARGRASTPPASRGRSTAPTSTSSPGRTTRQRIRCGACRRRGSGRSWPAV